MIVTINIMVIINITISSYFTKLLVTVLQTLKLYEYVVDEMVSFESHTVYCFSFAVKKFHSCKSFPSFPEKYLRLQNILPIMAKFEHSKLKFRLKTFAVTK